MSTGLRRREFLTAATAAVVAAQASVGIPALAAVNSASSRGEARLFPGCCAYSYLKHFNTGAMTMESFIQKAVELGGHSVDITTYWLKSAEPEYLNSLRHLAFKNGVAFSGIAIERKCAKAAVQFVPKRYAESINGWMQRRLLGLRIFAYSAEACLTV